MKNIKILNVLIYVGLFLLLSWGSKIVGLVTDYYWFKELQAQSVFIKMVSAELLLGFSSGMVVFGVLFFSWWLAKRRSKRPFVIIHNRGVFMGQNFPQLDQVRSVVNLILFAVMYFSSFVTGGWAAEKWPILLQYFNRTSFNVLDPLFNKDVSFFVFYVPLLQMVYQFFLIVAILSFLICAVTYFINDRIQLTDNGVVFADYVKNHLAVLGGILLSAIALRFYVQSLDLVVAQRGLAPGAGYADVYVVLPGLRILSIVSLFGAIMLFGYSYFKNKRLAYGAVIAVFLGSFFVRVVAATVQKFQVAPNEIVKETPYIKDSIANTRRAYGLDSVQELEFNPQESLDASAITNNDLTLKNIRLWDHRPLLTSFSQLQEIRTYYDFLDADNDRYFINGEYRQVMISARELVSSSLPSRIWINEHLTYTHGYGICLGPVNVISPEGLPEFFTKDIPPKTVAGPQVTQPQIYYGESDSSYAIVRTNSKEFDYPAGDDNVYTTYSGSGGVEIKNFLRKLLFAIKFGELKILLSKDIRADSRILYYRNIQERLSRLAPFLRFDPDAYIVVSDQGKLFWIMDGYTTTDRYPYSEKMGNFNYIRNSVKITVDAYNGTVRLYALDDQDPLLQTYRKMFPNLFISIDKMPADLRAHIRYPQSLMNVQARIYSTYHMTDPQVFYNKEDLWRLPVLGQSFVDPYYTIMKLSGVGQSEEFILMVPFTPAKKENMIAWMAARCDGAHYGKLLVYNFPKQKLVFGPQQIQSRIEQNSEISQMITLWDQGGSRVLRGSLLAIPVEQSLLYVQALYLEASGGGVPELKRIIVAYGNTIVMEETLSACLSKIFGQRLQSEKSDLNTGSSPVSSSDAALRTLLNKISTHFNRAQDALKKAQWNVYGQEMKHLENLLQSSR